MLENKQVQLVSMPSTTTFDKQNLEYQNLVLPKTQYKIAIEAGSSGSWYNYVGADGLSIGIDTFGESAPANELFNHFGFNIDKIEEKVKKYLGAK